MTRTTVALQTKTAASEVPAQGILRRACACGNHTAAGGECAECAKNKNSLQRNLARATMHAHPTATLMRASPASLAVEAVRGPGTPLPAEIQRAAALQYGQSFADVRLHTDTPASSAAASLNAAAFTLGSDIAFGAKRYAPATPQGQLLLRHELRHVAQQHSAVPAAAPELDAPHSRYESEARQILDPHVEALAVQRIQCAPEDADFSFGNLTRLGAELVLDGAGHAAVGSNWDVLKKEAAQISLGGVFDAMGQAAFGRAWPFLKALFEGFLEGIQADVKSGRADAATKRLTKMVLDPWAAPKFLLGFLEGMARGLVSPITDLVKGVIGVVQLGTSALQWLDKWSPAGIAASPERQQKIIRLIQKFDQLKSEYDKAIAGFKSHPEETLAKISAFLDDLMQAALGKAHEYGVKAAHSIFSFLELPDYEMGKGTGEVIGKLIINILLLVLTGPIAKLIIEAASFIGKTASFVAGKAAGVFKWVKGAASEVIAFLRQAVKGALKLFEGLLTKTIGAFEALAEIFSEAALVERVAEKAVAGGGRGVFGLLSKPMESRIVPSTVKRKWPTKVSDLKPADAPVNIPTADLPPKIDPFHVPAKPNMPENALPPAPVLTNSSASVRQRIAFIKRHRDLLGPRQRIDVDSLKGLRVSQRRLKNWERDIDQKLRTAHANQVAAAVGANPTVIKPVSVTAQRIPKKGQGADWERTQASLRGDQSPVTHTVRTDTDLAQFDSLGQPRGKVDPREIKSHDEPPAPRKHYTSPNADSLAQIERNNRTILKGLEKDISHQENRAWIAHELADQMERQARIARDLKWPPVKWEMNSAAIEAYFTDEILPLLPKDLRHKIQLISTHYFD